MTMVMKVWCQITVVFCIVVSTTAEKEYEDRLTKLWSLSSAANNEGARTAVVNVTSASIVIQPSVQETRTSRDSKGPSKYAFKPRAIPVKRSEQPSQVERSVYYSQDNNKYKSEVLFPGNYFPIAEEKSNENTQEAFNPLQRGTFQPKTIPLMRNQEFQRRSLDDDEEPVITKPEGFYEPSAQRRSIADFFAVDDEDEDDDDEGVAEDGEGEGDENLRHKRHKKTKKIKKVHKYMMPLLMAYKMKYFAMIPLAIAGLVLLIGATGMAGFFFALFAAVMALQKGSY